jgi:hypothetical protein
MKSFKTKDLMIGIQPEKSTGTSYAANALTEDLMEGYNFGNCDGDSVDTRCGQGKSQNTGNTNRHNESVDFHKNIINLADLKSMLAEMQIKLSTTV